MIKEEGEEKINIFGVSRDNYNESEPKNEHEIKIENLENLKILENKAEIDISPIISSLNPTNTINNPSNLNLEIINPNFESTEPKLERRKRKKKIDNDFITLSSVEDFNDVQSVVNSIHISITEDNYKCIEPDCGREFEDSNTLKKHMLIHGAKTFECPHPNCGKKFSDNSKLRRHSLVHTVKKDFLKNFREKNHLDANIVENVFL
jgi:hypothetical protein